MTLMPKRGSPGQREGIRVKRPVHDHLVALREQRQHERADRGHAGRQGKAGFGTFEACKPGLEYGGGRIVLAAIEHVALARRLLILCDAGKGVGRGEVDGWRDRPMVIGRVIGMMDGAGREAKMACVEPMIRSGPT